MMHHVAMDDDPGRAPGFGPPRIVDRFVVAVVAEQRRVAEGGEPPQILHGGGRRHAESERGGIRRHDQIIFLPSLQCQGRHAKGPVLIDVVPVDRAEGGFRDAPRHFALPGIGNLAAHGVVTGVIEQRIFVRLGEQKRHQIFEHRPVPGEKWQPPIGGAEGPAQSPPMFHRHFAARDGEETR